MFRFIHIPKTGGTTVEKALRRNGVEFLVGTGGSDNKRIADRHRFALHYAHENIPRVTVVRNPYTKLLSHYGWMRRLGRRIYNSYSFERFVREQFNIGRAYRAWFTQTAYTHTSALPGESRGRCLVDTVLRFETLNEDLARLYGCERIPHLNSTLLDPRDYYTRELEQMVRDAFAIDFEVFNYPLNPPWHDNK
jgi:hypothetical protein